ncbi:MAG: hypothetical protein ACKOUM_10895, partial [Sphingopyxis sp.]
LAAIDRTANDTLERHSASFAQLRDALEQLARRMSDVGDDVAPALLVNVAQAEQAASAAAERTRDAVADVARNSAQDLEKIVGDAMDRAVGGTAQERLAHLASAADQAISAADAASDRLMRQVITISESSAAMEARAHEAAAAVEHKTRDTMARKMAMMTEALQSTAVDITQLLASDVADQAWEAYLKGDRGIFARRAVRLLNAAEAKDLLRRYQEDEDFRGQVNRYIHDFEAMLRTVMDTRDGASLSVTLLSSDIGKVYVALAQSIERLRN